jgi:hypothetical protein
VSRLHTYPCDSRLRPGSSSSYILCWAAPGAPHVPLCLLHTYHTLQCVHVSMCPWHHSPPPHTHLAHLPPAPCRPRPDRYSAQRALEKDHQQLSGGLIVGVKVLSAQHREDVTQHVQGSPARQVRQPALPMRTYTINASAAQQLPRPGKGLLAKFSEFVIGI